MNKDLRIFRKYDSIKKFKKDIDKYTIKSVTDLEENTERFYSSSMIVFSMLNDLFSICEEFIDIRDFDLPENYHSIFKILRKNKIIDTEEEKLCFKLVTLRNMLAHEYDNFDENDVFELIINKEFIITLADRLIQKLNM